MTGQSRPDIPTYSTAGDGACASGVTGIRSTSTGAPRCAPASQAGTPTSQAGARPLWECQARLIRVAQGLEPADTVITGATLVNVNTHELLEDTGIAIADGRIAYVGIAPHTARHCIGPQTQVIDAAGLFAAPGFLDGHMHIESSMVGPAEYARAVVPHGTTGVFYDPHEICNVAGLEAVRVMAADARRTPMKAMLTVPSCVPAVPGFEDTGASVDARDIAATMAWDGVAGLGEMMNYPGVLAGDQGPLDEIAETLKAGRAVTGHFPVHDTDRLLNAYIASGVGSCHESDCPEDIVAKARLGMYAQIRQGSAWHNLRALAPAVADGCIDTRFVCMVSDDNHPNTLIAQGHMDHILRMAVEEGIDPVSAIQMVTINTATSFGLQQEIGSIAPGKCADIVLLRDLTGFEAVRVLIDGVEQAADGQALFDPGPCIWPEWMLKSMHLGRPTLSLIHI